MATIVGSLAENTNTNSTPGTEPASDSLVGWVMTRVNAWRDDRDSTYEQVWGEYWRLWRGRHVAADKTRESERSKIVTPALAQALEMTVAELEEASFGRENWIDLLDDNGDPDHEDIDGIAAQFLGDLSDDKVPSAIADAYLNGGLYGTLAAKVVVEKGVEPFFRQVPQEASDLSPPKMGVIFEPRVRVRVVAIPMPELIPDPNGTCVEDMLGIAHEVSKPRAWLLSVPYGIKYAKSGAGQQGIDAPLTHGDKEHPSLLASTQHTVLVTEYHGKVPKRLLDDANKNKEEEEEDPLAAAIIGGAAPNAPEELDGDGPMVEAIVTIFDKTHLALGIENPFLMKDRSIFTCQFDRVPGRFGGRGVMEKGYNPQKALDAEIRTRMDVMALIANPMMGADSTALPRGFDMRVRPGKVWMTNGNPKEALFPVQFPNLDPSSFAQTSEMERMVQMGTGAMDTATPLGENRRNETLGGTSLIAGTFIKRAKRALRNITDNFVEPIVRAILWRRMEFDGGRYPADFQFRVVTTLGIVAREVEQQQMTQMLSLVQPGQTQGLLIKAIFDGSASPFKSELQAALEADNQPDPAAQQLQQMQIQAAQLELAGLQLDVKAKEMDTKAKEFDIYKTVSATKLLEAQILLALASMEEKLSLPGIGFEKLRIERDKLVNDLEETRQFARQNDIAAFKAIHDAHRGITQDGNKPSPAN